ncbi:MAG: enoyl-CoA hydratase-related protein [SAR202 cluster bacterium]|jgi:enoyl-CoA hydratase/carnithine racemase|nr:enoyl-CoA hydratase-related protein [SAR202 cluster bacterium]MDP6300437.1 enoyl-CoA hydratase-related protein [SAR202 cluster bacterium]MDP7102429.1 enoyl-CoA hydratase-related protein [SAR202 cluster bacterium]MDP7224883.1 enoyl-CoA hydratase-related protein [SAR202 cluster bacterium]MDP7412059.1 enoyl-CoA hydratase-related protein [SAR202 cluster bacterium]|tara:strand:- start:1546 stop:2361 length:816 start_codon:yes stop_codon:yes gene_type:complete
MAYENIIYEKRDHIAYLTFNRPERRNAIDPPTQIETWNALNDFRNDNDSWVVILTGTGDQAFCAGADLKWRTENPDESPPWESNYQSDINRIGPAGALPTEIWKPMIAAVNGFAVGGGMEMTLHCDIVIASEHAQFGVPEIRHAGGLPGGGGIFRLPRQVPYKVAMWMLLSGQYMSAQYMHSVGYVNEVVPHAKLMETAEAYARLLTANPPIGVQTSKEVALRSLDLPLDHPRTAWEYLWEGTTAKMRNSEDSQESRRAWLEKRPPVFHNR